jgi:sigma-B regulation protein RsbU (phosphoserine phosphatase)
MDTTLDSDHQELRILIIDDDEKLGRLLRDYLQPFGYAVDLVHNGSDGLQQAIRGGYAAIILDVMLPGMSGFEVLREIRKRTSIPVIMHTALGDEPDRIAGLDVGADDYLPKTFSTQELLARLRAVLRRSELTLHQHKELQKELKDERRELDQAREIQVALLPREMPDFEGYEISGAWQPARIVSGDYYDVLKLTNDRLAVCIGDVSGKGMPAALLMANVQAAVKAFASDTVTPAELCRKVNGILYGNIPENRFMTFFYGTIDRRTNRFSYTCAGHNPPFLIRRDGAELRLDQGGTVLGLFSAGEYQQAEISLVPGDSLLLFTDGVTDAASPEDEEFGEERLARVLRRSVGSSAEELQKMVLREVWDFCGGNFHDDVTIVSIRAVDP